MEALTELSHVFSPDGLNNTSLPQGYLLETAPTADMVDATYIPRTGEEVGASSCPGPACESAPPWPLQHQKKCFFGPVWMHIGHKLVDYMCDSNGRENNF